MTAPSPRPERADARLNRERIIQAARDLFAEHGASVDVRVIAEHAGVGVGTIYRNFPAKFDLVAAVTAELLDEADRALARVLATDDPIAAVSGYITTLAETFARTSPLAMDVMAAPEFQAIKQRVLGWFADPRLEAVIQRGIDAGLFRPDLDVATARLFVAGAADPLVVMCAGGGAPLAPALLHGLVDLVLRALLAPGVPLPASPGAKGT
jgi:AcrR family transcriptional regulator